MKKAASGVVAGAMIAGVVAALLVAFGPKTWFTIDGYDYAIVMLMDRGMPYAQAQRRAAAFYAERPVAATPDGRWLRGKPEYWELFSVRRVDSWLASLLYPWRGFNALVDVSRLSYVLVAVLVVVLASRFAPVGYGVLLSVLLSAFPPWRALAHFALTDALAVATMTVTLIAAAAYVTKRSPARLVLFAAACGVLAFTRPIAYVVAGGAAIALLAALVRKDRQAAIGSFWLMSIATLWTLVTLAALEAAHAPSIGWIVADSYHHLVARGYEAAGQNLGRWYVKEELTILWHAVRDGLLLVVPVVAIAGIALRRRDPATPVLAGACAATWLGAIVDPMSFDMVRAVVLPVAPVMAAFAAGAAGDGVTFVLRLLGPATQSLRQNLPGLSTPRKDTVKE